MGVLQGGYGIGCVFGCFTGWVRDSMGAWVFYSVGWDRMGVWVFYRVFQKEQTV